MNFEFDKDKPIYKQIISNIKVDIITNTYKSGEKIPSVREYAIDLKVNPNTINRALLELEEIGLIVTKRTNGKFITEDIDIINKIKKEFAVETINKFLIDMKKINISEKEVIELIKGE